MGTSCDTPWASPMSLFCLQPPDFRDLLEWEPRIREAFRAGDLESKPDPSRNFRPYRAEDNDSYASEVGLGLSKLLGGSRLARTFRKQAGWPLEEDGIGFEHSAWF